MKNKNILTIIFFLSLMVRLGLFYTIWGDLRHGSALDYGSTAIGYFNAQGLSKNSKEIEKINLLGNNYSGNYLKYYEPTERQKFIEFLPGPAILMGLLWKVVPVYNFSPYIWIQIILETILILLFYIVFKKRNKYITLLATIFMIFNLPAIHKTLMVGYDFWPQFAVLVTTIGIYSAIVKNKPYLFFITGLFAGITVWFRSITSFLPFFIGLFIFFYQKYRQKKRFPVILKNTFYYIFPVVLLMLSLSIYRYNQTGNLRPTRSTFWHSFFCGVGRFSNPYGITSNDESVWEFGKRLNPDISKFTFKDMNRSPNSMYESTLKKQAVIFIKEQPEIFIRNIFYRIGIMISPPLKVGNTTLMTSSQKNFIFPFGFVLLFLWIVGFIKMYKSNKLLFYLCLTIYLYFFVAFSWFYVVGRVILSFLFINIIVYLFGIKYLIKKFSNRNKHASTNTTT